MSQSRDELERERDELDRKMVRDAAKWQDRLNLMHDQVLTAQAERDEARRQTEEACEQFAKMRDSRDSKQIELDEARRERDAAYSRGFTDAREAAAVVCSSWAGDCSVEPQWFADQIRALKPKETP